MTPNQRVLVLLAVLSANCTTDIAKQLPATSSDELRATEIRQRMHLASEKKTNAGYKARFDSPDEAAEYAWLKRLGSTDGIDSIERMDTAKSRMRFMQHHETTQREARASDSQSKGTDANDLTWWTSIGPGNIGGRTRTLIIDPRNPDTMYTGGVSGGLWKSTNGGARWNAIGEGLENLAINSLVMHPTDSSILWAGTGEGYFREEVRGTGLPLRGAGIFMTRDSGEHWERIESTRNQDFHWVNDLVVSPLQPQRIYAATRTGVLRSEDEGSTWTRILSTTVKGGCLDLEMRPSTEGDFLFASCGTLERATVYRNQHAQSTSVWESVLSESSMGRTSLAVSASNPNIIYALAASNDLDPRGFHRQGILAVFRSDQNGAAGTWTARVRNNSSEKLSTLLLSNAIVGLLQECGEPDPNVYIPMGWYVNTIAVDPQNPNTVFVSGVDLFRSDDGGSTWGSASYWWIDGTQPQYVHGDIHRMVFHPGYDGASNQTFYVANDGGIYRTSNALAPIARGIASACDPSTSSVSWTPLRTGLGITQFYHGAPFAEGTRYLAGAQDNGTLIGGDAEGPEAWRRIFGGDGGYVAVDPNNENIIYVEYQNAQIQKSVNGGQTFQSATNGLRDGAPLFITPFAMDPGDSQRLWTGGNQLWRTDNGASFWTAASLTISPGRVSAIAISQTNPDHVLAGTHLGAIHRSTNARSANALSFWPSVTPREGFVSWIAFDPADPSIVWATYSGFGGAHVWRSADGGGSWTACDGSDDGQLPDIPVHAIVVDPGNTRRLYIGTDLGVFVSTNEGATWMIENTGFENVVTESLAITRSSRGWMLFAFTHGRGAWRVELEPSGRRRRSVR